MQFIQSLRLDSLLSFPPGTDKFDLQPLNVLIGPNGAGKSNVIEVLELLHSTPVDFAGAIRDGGGVREWLWKGEGANKAATIDIVTGDTDTQLKTPTGKPLRYRLEFTEAHSRVEVLDEAIEDVEPSSGHAKPFFYYRYQHGRPTINIREFWEDNGRQSRALRREDLVPDQSVLAQRQDPLIYPEVTWLGRKFRQIQVFREWTFGRHAPLRLPQPADLPEERLLSDSLNLALLLNQIEHKDSQIFNQMLERFFPRFKRMSTKVSGGTVQFYLHEADFRHPIPSTRLSDGTIRFVAILALLLSPSPPPIVCIEEPELGLHPDAVALVADLLVEASSRMQLLVTTHSDALVSALSDTPDAVVACERPGAGTVLRRLDPKQLKFWLEDYQLGDLWRIGELGANP